MLDNICNFSQTGLPQRADCLALFWENRSKVSFPKIQQSLPSSETEQRADNLAVANLRSRHFLLVLHCHYLEWQQ